MVKLLCTKDLLLDRKISIRRQQLFNATVGSIVSLCTEWWALRVEDKLKLKGGLNAMLMIVVNISLAKDEDSVE